MTHNTGLTKITDELFTARDLTLQVRKWGAEIIEKHSGRKASLEFLWRCEHLIPILGDEWQMTNFKSKLDKKYSFFSPRSEFSPK